MARVRVASHKVKPAEQVVTEEMGRQIMLMVLLDDFL